MSPDSRAAAERWLALSENRDAWQRLQHALELADGFQFLPIHLVNAAAEDLLRPLLTEWCRREGKHLAGFRLDEPGGDESLLSLILQELRSASRPCIFFFPCGKALYRGLRTPEGQARLRDFFLFLNQKRDVIARRAAAPFAISLHPQDWKEFRRHAPDFWSIHQAVWRFSGPVAEEKGLSFSLDAPLEARETTNEPLELSAPTAPRMASTTRPTSFIGRKRELEIVTATLRSGSHVVIEGIAGVGKTTLAREAAHQLRPVFRDGVLAFDLLGVTDPASAAPIRSRVIRHFLPRRPTSAGEGSRALYVEATREGRSLLLILENVEDASVLKELEPAKGCRLLITSRGGLRLPPVYRRVSLSGLGLKESRRWLERQGLSKAHAAALIQAVGGHPLSIRLAAGLLTQPGEPAPKDLLTRLRREAGAAPGVLRVALETAVESLGPDQRFLWRRLAVFPGLFGAREAAGISGLELHLVHGILESLVQRGMIAVADQELFQIHGLLREFARELLRKADDETPARDAHARHFLERLKSVAPTRRGSSLRAGLSPYEAILEMRPPLPAEHGEELAIAQAWILERCKAPLPAGREARELILELGTGGAEQLLQAQTPIQRMAWAEILRQTAEQKGLSRVAEDAAALASRAQLDRASSEKCARYVLKVARARGDRTREAEALRNLGIAQEQAGELDAATRSFQQASKVFRELEDLRGESLTLVLLGDVLSSAVRTEHATEALERALELMQQLDDEVGGAFVLTKLGDVRAQARDFSRAEQLYEQAILIFRDHKHTREEGGVLRRLAENLKTIGNDPEAARAFRRASELLREAGDLAGTSEALLGLGRSLFEAGDPRSAIGNFDQALQIARELGDRYLEVYALGSLGIAYRSSGESARAIELLEQARSIAREIDAPKIASSVEEALKRLRETP